MTINKKCNCCGKVHFEVPTSARAQLTFNEDQIEGWLWECDCKSTMFVKVIQESQAQAMMNRGGK